MLRFSIGFLCLIFVLSTSAQKVEDGWKGLQTFKSTKADVDKILGSGGKTKPWSIYPYEYHSDGAVVGARFSTVPCDENEEYFFRHNLPAETLLDYTVTFVTAIPITALSFDKNRFERDKQTDQNGVPTNSFTFRQLSREYWKVPNHWSAGTGIEFWGDTISGKDYVLGVHYGRPYSGVTEVSCDKSSATRPSIDDSK